MFKINGIRWRVLLVSPFHPKLGKSIGSCDANTRTIYINNELSQSKFKKVLCHEITHAAMFSYKVKLTYEQEELFAEIIANYGEEIINITNKIKGNYAL